MHGEAMTKQEIEEFANDYVGKNIRRITSEPFAPMFAEFGWELQKKIMEKVGDIVFNTLREI
jgi:hypothetical protein